MPRPLDTLKGGNGGIAGNRLSAEQSLGELKRMAGSVIPSNMQGWVEPASNYYTAGTPHLTYTSGNLNGQTMSYNAANISTTGGNR